MKLKSMVVFMNHDQLSDLVELLLKSPNCKYEDVQLKKILVYLDDDHLYRIADALASGEATWTDVKKMLVFCDQHALHRLIEGVRDGNIDMEYWKMYPYLEDDAAVEMLECVVLNHLPPKGLYPFVPSWGFSRIVDMYEQGLIDEAMLDDMYIWMDDEDIRRVMKQSLRNRMHRLEDLKE